MLEFKKKGEMIMKIIAEKGIWLLPKRGTTGESKTVIYTIDYAGIHTCGYKS